MEEPFFFSWFKNEFIVHINKIRNNQNLPNESAVLIFDGHSSYISIRIIKGAIDNNIELIRLPSHLTDRIQSLDKCVFGPVKIKWDKKLVEHGKKQMGNVSSRLSKGEFSKLLGLVLKESVTPQNVKNGFISTGLFPINHPKFPKHLFDPVDLEQYKTKKKTKCRQLLKP
ncbi:hypothetical protein NQ314_010234 [Rhamnusium bicolor]|uniref:DDE-1 domain-containing protein n=1 Tax=Rhamnusium bicolor TaxID=1586634 RepID=A0AAV8XT20_9CUCU|nr:hypothetical protein NQ314_010234 [Rhamnusium bicolor]